jgi:catechol 2,3-dioxygenase-like lactoylglutathione lyase family enzyme
MPGVHHIALRVRDCDLSARFYERALGLREIRRVSSDGDLRAVWLRAGETVLMLERSLRGEGLDQGSGHVLVFPTSDLKEAEKNLGALQIAITDRTASTLYFQDPDGHRAGLSIYAFDQTPS